MGPHTLIEGGGWESKKGLNISVLSGIYFRILHRLDCVKTPFTFSGKAYESAFLSLQGWGV